MHFLAGFWVGAVAVAFLRHHAPEFSQDKKNILLSIVFIFGATLFVGVFWEFFEFGLGEYILQDTRIVDIGNLWKDTLLDLFMDFLGSVVIVLIFIKTRYA